MATDSSLLPVIVGGLLATGGGAASAWFTNWLQRSSDARKRRADKFEEMVAALYEFDHWIAQEKRRVANGEEISESMSPFAKLQSICLVYFPMFRLAVSTLGAAAEGYRLWMQEFRSARSPYTTGKPEPEQIDVVEVLKDYHGARNALEDRLKQFAKKEFGPEHR